jgi:outer membrane receptor for ferrienterochelin and colicins
MMRAQTPRQDFRRRPGTFASYPGSQGIPQKAFVMKQALQRPPLTRLAPQLLSASITLVLAHWAVAQTPAGPSPAEPPSANRPDKPKAAVGETGKTELDRVQVTGSAETEARRQSTAAKIVVGREEIDKYGDSNLAEVLKRLPGVQTGGRQGRGDIRMRGMGGAYTQLLINGEPIPPGFALDSVPPEQVERIEILRAPSAEFGARAIAGTINIVLRQAIQKRLNEVRLGSNVENGQTSGMVSWTRNDRLSTPGSAYNLSLSANRGRSENNTLTDTEFLAPGGTVVAKQRASSTGKNLREGLHFSGRVQWRPNEADSFALQPFAMVMRSTNRSEAEQRPLQGSAPLPWSLLSGRSESTMQMLRLNAQWQRSFSEKSRMDLRFNGGGFSSEADTLTRYTPTRALQDQTDARERSANFSLKLSSEQGQGHNLVGGLEVDGAHRTEDRNTWQDGQPLATGLNGQFGARTLRTAAYAQDEWAINPNWSAYAGLRWEGIETRSESALYPAHSRSGVWTPLLHALWKPDAKRKDQVRMSLTRSYKAPGTSALIARPRFSSDYPLSGPNVSTQPDSVGNPLLQPELATGLDLAYEKYLPTGGFVGVNFFRREIQGLIRNLVSLQPVGWSSSPRWVSRPENVGKAITQGLEFEARGRLNEWWPEMPAINVRGNFSLYNSSVSSVPGPDNRIDQQPRATGNLGLDYRFKEWPLQMGGNVNLTPGYTIRSAVDQTTTTGLNRQAEIFGSWSFSPEVQLRLSANSLFAPDAYSLSTTANSRRETVSSTYTQVGARLEVKL